LKAVLLDQGLQVFSIHRIDHHPHTEEVLIYEFHLLKAIKMAAKFILNILKSMEADFFWLF